VSPRRIALFTALVAACGGSQKATGPTLPPPQAGEAAAREPGAASALPAVPPETKEEADPWKGRTDLIPAPPPAKPSAVSLPKVERFTLDNGLKVRVVVGHDLPVVSFHLAVLAGEQDEPKGKRSLAGYAAEMLTKGTKKHSAQEIARTIEFVGGSLGASADLEATYVSCSSLSKTLSTCLSLLGEVVVTPTFPEAEMKTVSEQLVASVKRVRDEPSELASAHLENGFWGDDHVRGWPDTVEAVLGITQKDLQDWHRTRFVPGNAILAVAGDVDPKQLRAELNRTFAGWKEGAPPPAKRYPEPAVKGITVRLVDKPELNQAKIAIAGWGISHRDPDYLATSVMNFALGAGSFGSRLMRVVRSAGGKTYSASSGFERWKSRGMFEAQTFTRNSETVATLKLVLDEIKKMHDEGPTAAEVADAKSNLAGEYPSHFESAGDVATAVLSSELHGLGEDWVRNYPLRVDAVTLEQARAAARKHLDPQDLVVVIVGKADEIKPQLDLAGMKYQTIGWLEPISKAERDAKTKSKAGGAGPGANGPIDPKKTDAGKKLLDAALAAQGGEAKVKGLKTVRSTGKIRLHLGSEIAEGDWVGTFVVPDKLRLDVTLAKLGVTVTQVVTPQGSWQVAGPNVQALPKDQADEAVAGLWRAHELILMRHREPGTVVQALAKEKVGEVSYDVVAVRRQDGSDDTRILLDPKTHHIFRLVYDQQGGGSTEEFGDWRMVDGLAFPFKQHSEGGRQSFDVVVSEVKVNGDVPAAQFVMPKK
jgi:zinc protease